MVDGVVTKVDRVGRQDHHQARAHQKFDMEEGHAMVFRAKEPKMLKVKPGDKIKFEADKVSSQFTVTKIQKAKK
jgi:Cu/Ag efflux protein CusF